MTKEADKIRLDVLDLADRIRSAQRSADRIDGQLRSTFSSAHEVVAAAQRRNHAHSLLASLCDEASDRGLISHDGSPD